MVQRLHETAGQSMCRYVPRKINAIRYIRHSAQDCQQRVGMASPDAVCQELRFFGIKLKGNITLQEVVGHWSVDRPHHPRLPCYVPVVIAFMPDSPEGRCPLSVFGEAEVEPPNTPGTQSTPVDLAWHPLEVSTRGIADHPLVWTEMTETINELGLIVTKSVGEIARRDAFALQSAEDPR